MRKGAEGRTHIGGGRRRWHMPAGQRDMCGIQGGEHEREGEDAMGRARGGKTQGRGRRGLVVEVNNIEQKKVKK